MTTVNCNSSAYSNGTKCQEFAGVQYNGLHSHIAKGETVEMRADCNGKYQSHHTSSNGYYGYLPIMPETDNDAMDTTEHDAEYSMRHEINPVNCTSIESRTFTNSQNVNGNVLSIGITLGRRKRINAEDNSPDGLKKQRTEEYCGLTPVKVLPTSRNYDAHYPRCIMGHYV